LRSNFSSSRLVRLLNGWAPAEAGVSRQDFAERLGQWVGVSDAITLHGTHQAITSAARRTAPPAHGAAQVAVEDEFQRVRTALVHAIKADDAGRSGYRNAPDTGPTYASYRKRYVDLQRHMEMRIAALRSSVRQALSTSTPALAQLAALDAVLDEMLVDREQKLMSAVPVFLERRFEALRRQQSVGWPDVFDEEMRQLLLAELDDRLQPVAGLVEAFSNVHKSQP